MFNTLGDMDKEEFEFENVNSQVGVFMSDTGLFQRTYSDDILQNQTEDLNFESDNFDDEFMKNFITSGYFPNFYGLTLPLLKYGLPVRPIQLDNLRRFAGYLDDYKFAILSYESCKPVSPDINNSIAQWVKSGGVLVYVGDGKDPYHKISGWWNQGNNAYETPSQHLLDMLGIDINAKQGEYKVGRGSVVLWDVCPAQICLTKEKAEQYRNIISGALSQEGQDWEYTNQLTLRRGQYVICAVMNESICDNSKVFEGVFADMLTSDFEIITRKEVLQNENALLSDITKIPNNNIVGTSARISKFEITDEKIIIEALAPESVNVNIRVKLAGKVKTIDSNVDAKVEFEPIGNTHLITYKSAGKKAVIDCLL